MELPRIELAARRRRAAVVVSLLVQLGFALACAAPGQRASMSADGSAPCLPGETCSSLAPAGLYFSTLSHAPLGAPPAVTAVGGAQTVFFTGATGGDLSATVDRGLATATVNPAQPDTTPSFVFKPQSEGDALVSIRERSSRALLDRITLSAAVARQVDLRVRWGIYGARPLGAIWAGASVRTEAFASSFAAGAQVDLVDDAWSMSSSDSTVLAVDHRTLRARREGFSSVQIRIGDSTLPRGVSVVSTIDALEVADASTGEALSSPWPVSDRLLMVRGRAGRTPVEGAPITMTPSHPEVSPESAASLDPEDPAFYLLPMVEVAAPRRLPVVFRSGAVELRGELLLAPRS